MCVGLCAENPVLRMCTCMSADCNRLRELSEADWLGATVGGRRHLLSSSPAVEWRVVRTVLDHWANRTIGTSCATQLHIGSKRGESRILATSGNYCYTFALFGPRIKGSLET